MLDRRGLDLNIEICGATRMPDRVAGDGFVDELAIQSLAERHVHGTENGLNLV